MHFAVEVMSHFPSPSDAKNLQRQKKIPLFYYFWFTDEKAGLEYAHGSIDMFD